MTTLSKAIENLERRRAQLTTAYVELESFAAELPEDLTADVREAMQRVWRTRLALDAELIRAKAQTSSQERAA